MAPHADGGDPHEPVPRRDRGPVRIGIGGPVGSGKTALVAALCRQPQGRLSLAVVTNDIYTTEDADFLRRNAVLPDVRITAVQTGCCPHTAIRDDITANLDAIDDLVAANPPLDLVLVESGGDNLTAPFSRGLVDAQIFVVDVAGGDKVPRKGGPGVTLSDPCCYRWPVAERCAPNCAPNCTRRDRHRCRLAPNQAVRNSSV